MIRCSTPRYRQKRERNKVEHWNDNYQIGQKVRVRFLPESAIKEEKVIETVTRSKAYIILSMAVVQIENLGRPVLLDQLEAI